MILLVTSLRLVERSRLPEESGGIAMVLPGGMIPFEVDGCDDACSVEASYDWSDGDFPFYRVVVLRVAGFPVGFPF